MRLTQLRSFHAVACTGSFTAAAQSLHVSQPTVTTQVGQLESLYNVELFHRSGRRVRLSEVGAQLWCVSRNMFDLEAEAVALLRDAGQLCSGHLRVAAVGPSHVTSALVAFKQRYPGVKVSVSTGNSQDVMNRLLDCSADIGVLAQSLQDRRFVSVPYSEHPVVIFCNSAHRFAHKRSIRMADLQGERVILREQGSTTRRALEAALRAARVEVQVIMEVASREIIREAVRQGLGVAAVSEVEHVPHANLHTVRIRDARVHTCAHVMCLAERRQTRLVQAFFQIPIPSGGGAADAGADRTRSEKTGAQLGKLD